MPQNNNIQEVPADDLPENLVPEDDLPKAGKDAKLADLENYQYEQIPEALGYLGGGLGLGYGLAEEGVKGTRNVVKWAERAMAGRQPIVGQFNPNITNAPSAPPMTPGQRYGQAMHGGTFTTSPDMGDIYAAGREATDFRRANPMWDVKEGTGLAVPKPSFEQQRAELAAQKTPMARAKQIGTNVLESTPARAAGLAGRIVAPAYGGYQLGYQGTQAYNRLANPQGAGDIAAGVANIGGAGLGAYTMVPSRPVRVGKVTVPSRVPAAIGSYLLGIGADALANDRNREQKSVLEKAAGGAIQGYANKGKVELVEGGLSALKKLASAVSKPRTLEFPTAEEVAKFVPKETKQGKFSDFLQNHIDEYLGIHQSDRLGTHGNYKGGTNFPNFQNIDPLHAKNEVVWMNNDPNAAKKLIKSTTFNSKPVIWTNYIGKENQHKSNRGVFNEILADVYKNNPNISDEQAVKIAQRMKALTGKDLDIRDKFLMQEIGGETFDSRGKLADMFGLGFGRGKDKLILSPNYQKILDESSEEFTKGAPTSAIGTRLHRIYDEPTQFSNAFHPDYDYVVHGKDMGVQFAAAPHTILDWTQNYIKEGKGGKGSAIPHGNAWMSYMRNPQYISEDFIKRTQSEGFAEGGGVDGYADGKKVVKSALGFFKPSAKSHSQDPEVAKALEDYLKGNISQQQRIDIVNQRLPLRPWTEMPPAYTDEQIKMALMENKRPKALVDVPAGMRVGNRLDIPAYTQHGVYVDTTHNLAGSNSPISYNRTGHLKDVEFSSKPNQAVRVGLGTKEQALTPMGVEMGAAKSPFAMIKGTNIGTKDEEVRRMMAEYLNDPDWAQIGMDPRRHSQFYDKATGMPVWSAEEKLQSGPLVLVPRRGLEVTSWDDPRLNLTDFPDKKYAGGGLACLKEGGKTPAWQRKEGKNPNGGLNAKGRASYNRETGGNLKRPQPEGGKRRDSFCARMKGMKKKLTSAETANDPDSRINKSLRAWNC